MADPSAAAHPAAPADWPQATRAVHEGLRTYRIVGASACAAAVLEGLAALAESLDGRDDVEVARALREAGAAFAALKPDTALYLNAVAWLVDGPGLASGTAGADAVRARVRRYTEARAACLATIVAHACAVLPADGAVLVHDLSTTVLAILGETGRRAARDVLVTEGTPVGQGAKVARAALEAGHRVAYLPDAAVGRAMDEVGVVLTGVETLYRNGDLANTVGTYPIALLAREHGVPVYAPTELLKIHPTAARGRVSNLRAAVLHAWPPADTDLPQAVAVRRHVLDLTPGALVTGYVTERGVLAPGALEGLLEEALAAL